MRKPHEVMLLLVKGGNLCVPEGVYEHFQAGIGKRGKEARKHWIEFFAGRVVGMHTFDASAPLKELQGKFGFEPDAVASIARELLATKG